MSKAPEHPQESKRLAALKALNILDTPPEVDFDDIVELCAEVCNAPICLITVIEEERQWFKAKVGLDVDQTPRELAFCTFCILQDGIFEIEDTHKDERVADNPLVTGEPFIRAYAGAPIWTKDGFPIGSLCVIKKEPSKLNAFQRKTLTILANQVSKQMELRMGNTELREVTQELNAHRDNLQQIIRVIGHDLRNPIGGLTSMLEILSQEFETFDQDDIKDYLTEMITSSNQAFSLLENLLEWSKAEAGMSTKKIEPVDLTALICEVLDSVAPMAFAKELEVIENIQPELQLSLDKRMIASVLRNLLTNAIKFSNKQGRIELKAEVIKDSVRVEVRDFGVGMEADQVDALLCHKKISSTYGTSGEKGIGIGIGLTHDFLAQHGSRLHIESSPDKGTRASFDLGSA